MDTREFYEKIGGNYDEVCSRLLKEERVLKYLGKFNDSKELDLFHQFLEEENYPEAFRQMHSLKGVALNLALTPLATCSSALCEELRPQVKPVNDITGMIAEVDQTFQEVKEALAELLG